MSDIRSSQVAAVAAPAMLERVSWGAVIAGAVIALAVLMVLNLIGLAMGLYAVDATSQDLGAEGAAALTGIWWALSALLALFIGGWISSKLAGNPDPLVSGIHGAAVWAAATLLAIFAVSSAMSAAFTGAAGMVGRAAQAGGQTQAGAQTQSANPLPALDPTDAALTLAARNLAEDLERQGIAADDDVLEQASAEALRQAITPAERNELSSLAQQAAASALQDPEAADAQFAQFTQRAFGASGVIDQTDRNAAAALIGQRTGATTDQVETMIAAWQNQYVAGPQLDGQIREWRAGAATDTDEAAGNVAGAALWTALGLILALGAAVGGGFVGRPRTVLTARPLGDPIPAR